MGFYNFRPFVLVTLISVEVYTKIISTSQFNINFLGGNLNSLARYIRMLIYILRHIKIFNLFLSIFIIWEKIKIFVGIGKINEEKQICDSSGINDESYA